jgi:hypothetical protein
MDHSRDIESERDIGRYMDVDRSFLVYCMFEHMARILRVYDMICRMYGIHMGGGYRIFDRRKLDLENTGRV